METVKPEVQKLTKDQIKVLEDHRSAVASLSKDTIVLWPNTRPIAMEYHHGNIYELVTIPDVSPSLAQMVKTGNVIPAGSSQFYEYDDLPDDDDAAHEMDDASLIARQDAAVKDLYVTDFVNNPDNYEKPEKTDVEKGSPEVAEKASSGAKAKDSDKES